MIMADTLHGKFVRMLILLPPSETKSTGGTGKPLNLSGLTFPELNDVRQQIADELVHLCRAGNEVQASKVLGLSEKLAGEIEENRQLFDSPTTPALSRYTGVLYDALEPDSLTDRARSRLAVGSALFGVIGGEGEIPHYRLSGGVKLNGATLKSKWGKTITEVLATRAEDDLVIDLRSGTYQQLGKLKGAVTVRVESVQPDGSRKVVSHFNKHYKGLLARELASSRADATDIKKVKTIATQAGFTMEDSPNNPNELVMVV